MAGSRRRNASTMTANYIEVLNGQRETADRGSQTQSLVTVEPETCKRRAMQDKATQIHEADARLAPLDEELEPLVRVLANRTLQQARMEVLEEQEQHRMRRERQRHVQTRFGLSSEIQRIGINQFFITKEKSRKLSETAIHRQQTLAEQKKAVARRASAFCVARVHQIKRGKLARLGFFETSLSGRIGETILGGVISAARGRVIRKEQLKFTILRIWRQARAMLSQMHNESVRMHVRRRGLPPLGPGPVEADTPQTRAQSPSPTDEADRGSKAAVEKVYIRRRARADEVTFGDSFGMFSIYFRNLAQVRDIEQSLADNIKVKSSIKASKTNTTLQNPEHFGSANRRLPVRRRLVPGVPVPGGGRGHAPASQVGQHGAGTDARVPAVPGVRLPLRSGLPGVQVGPQAAQAAPPEAQGRRVQRHHFEQKQRHAQSQV